MKQKLFNKDISPQCSICKHGKNTPDGKEVICHRKGVIAADYVCKKYVYDVLKRSPRRKNEEEISEDEVKL